VRSKQRDPSFKVPYIPGTASMPRTKTKKRWEFRHQPAVYMPAHVKLQDHSQFYMKTPQEMSRHEIMELEKELKALDDPSDVMDMEDPFEIDKEGRVISRDPAFTELQDQVRKLIPIRYSIIRRYFERLKYQRKKRDEMLAAVEESEQ
jgi:hypothetical protein